MDELPELPLDKIEVVRVRRVVSVFIGFDAAAEDEQRTFAAILSSAIFER